MKPCMKWPPRSRSQLGAYLMTIHRFHVGQTVQFEPSFQSSVPGGAFKVEQLLPADNGGNQYRVLSTRDGHRRVVRESEIFLP
jgi:hypothetical protein